MAPSCWRTALRGYSGSDCRFARQLQSMPGSEQYTSDTHLQYGYVTCPLSYGVFCRSKRAIVTEHADIIYKCTGALEMAGTEIAHSFAPCDEYSAVSKCCPKFGHWPGAGVPRLSNVHFGTDEAPRSYNTAHIGAREQTSAAERRWEKVRKTCTPDS